MTKSEAIKIFGTRQQDLADAIGVTRSAVAQWPEDLPKRQTDIVVGAAVRLGKWPCCEPSDGTAAPAKAA